MEIGLNLGLRMGMGINRLEWEGMGLKKTFPLISTACTHLAVGDKRTAVDRHAVRDTIPDLVAGTCWGLLLYTEEAPT